MIRPMNKKDIPAISCLYVDYMFDSFFSKLGKRFLVIIFEEILSSEYGISYVWEDNSLVSGFIISSTDSQRLFRAIFRKRILALTGSIILRVFKKPGLLLNILESFSYFKNIGFRDVPAELLFIVIDPRFRNQRISRELISETLAQLQNNAVRRVKVTTQKNNQVVNNLLKSFGFNPVKSFVFYGKESLLYEVAIPAHEKNCQVV